MALKKHHVNLVMQMQGHSPLVELCWRWRFAKRVLSWLEQWNVEIA
jgi:hypothetical protein